MDYTMNAYKQQVVNALAMDENNDQRLHPRVQLKGYVVDITMNGLVYTTILQDASLKGIALLDLPDRFFTTHDKQFIVIVSNFLDLTHYKLTVDARWSKINGSTVSAGFYIADAPSQWNSLITMETLDKANRNHHFSLAA